MSDRVIRLVQPEEYAVCFSSSRHVKQRKLPVLNHAGRNDFLLNTDKQYVVWMTSLQLANWQYQFHLSVYSIDPAYFCGYSTGQLGRVVDGEILPMGVLPMGWYQLNGSVFYAEFNWNMPGVDRRALWRMPISHEVYRSYAKADSDHDPDAKARIVENAREELRQLAINKPELLPSSTMRLDVRGFPHAWTSKPIDSGLFGAQLNNLCIAVRRAFFKPEEVINY